MTKKKTESLYRALGAEAQAGAKRVGPELAASVKALRLKQKLTAADLCRRAGDLDPRTFSAFELGRIKNPSLKTLEAICRGLDMSLAELFREDELEKADNLYVGSQKGAFQADFPSWGIRVVSFTPFLKDFFCGKLTLGPKRLMDQTFLRHRQPLFVSAIVGRVEITVEDRKIPLREGENIFFNGKLRHSFYNPLEREAVLLLVTAPSFL